MSGLTKIAAILNTGRWTATCGGSKCSPGDYAYVFGVSTSDHNTYLCDRFFDAPRGRVRDSQPGTIIHELAHFVDIHSANDYAYGTSAMEALAISDYAKARKNADSVEVQQSPHTAATHSSQSLTWMNSVNTTFIWN